MGEPFTMACTHIEARPPSLWQQTGGRTYYYPSPSWFLSAAPMEGIAAERNGTTSWSLREIGGGTSMRLLLLAPS